MAVIGVGLIGGSLAGAARRAGLVRTVIGCGRSPENLATARRRRLIDRATTDPAEAAAGADLVVLAVPVGTMAAVAAAIASRLAPGAVVTDVGSVKGAVVAALEPLCARVGAAFVGAHPIAGSEAHGAGAADPRLFRGQRCILTPTPTTDRAALARVRALWEGVGMRVEEMEAAAHDAILARVSHVPHLLAYALTAAVAGACAGEHELLAYAGSGFRDTTRIAASPADLWRDIALANRPQVLAGLDEFGAALDAIVDLVRREDGTALERVLAAAQRRRVALGTAAPARPRRRAGPRVR
jgi:prephenate dehydrogenase